ncbi:MAG: hypothetical protein HY057_08495, partial [Rhodospirillales bacterium]|nr:hypothetical protein [Rhodospirillales bacterium]
MAIPHASAPPDNNVAPFASTPVRRRVLLPLPLAGAYDYRVLPGLALQPGDFVRVPLGRRMATGVVWDDAPLDATDCPVPAARLKDVAARLDLPPLCAPARRFIEWVAAYTLSPPGAVLRMTMSVPGALDPPRAHFGYRLAVTAPDPQAETQGKNPDGQRLTPARRRVLREAS